ncbi:MAG TPA: nuclear transport factor 2 family protein [Candidatus Dormibacteraeota bacterium]|nr:nuclear transport factor 2 family protein [Candidatus Dormibacteraeota bacterium]
MKKNFTMNHGRKRSITALVLLLAFAFLMANVSLASGQKDKKKKKDEAQPADNSKPLLLNDSQRIDYLLSEMLGAWQVGDVDKLHSTYADDVSMVNGSWAPPVIGWTNYLAIYQQQRSRMQRVRMDRFNTYIKVNGNSGWACYQWDFYATVDGQPTQSQGQTTIVVEKRNNQWVIVHNHTSLTSGASQTSPANTTTPQQTPTKPNGFF